MIELKRSTDNGFYFIVRAINGQVLVTSEVYTQKHNAISAIDSLANQMYQLVNSSRALDPIYKDLTND